MADNIKDSISLGELEKVNKSLSPIIRSILEKNEADKKGIKIIKELTKLNKDKIDKQSEEIRKQKEINKLIENFRSEASKVITNQKALNEAEKEYAKAIQRNTPLIKQFLSSTISKFLGATVVLAALTRELNDLTIGTAKLSAMRLQVRPEQGYGIAGSIVSGFLKSQELVLFGKSLGFTNDVIKGTAESILELGGNLEDTRTALMAQRVFGKSIEESTRMTTLYNKEMFYNKGNRGKMATQEILYMRQLSAIFNLPSEMITSSTEEMIQTNLGYTKSMDGIRNTIYRLSMALSEDIITVREFGLVTREIKGIVEAASGIPVGQEFGYIQFLRMQNPSVLPGKLKTGSPFETINDYRSMSPQSRASTLLEVGSAIAKMYRARNEEEAQGYKQFVLQSMPGWSGVSKLSPRVFDVIEKAIRAGEGGSIESIKESVKKKYGVKGEQFAEDIEEAMADPISIMQKMATKFGSLESPVKTAAYWLEEIGMKYLEKEIKEKEALKDKKLEYSKEFHKQYKEMYDTKDVEGLKNVLREKAKFDILSTSGKKELNLTQKGSIDRAVESHIRVTFGIWDDKEKIYKKINKSIRQEKTFNRKLDEILSIGGY